MTSNSSDVLFDTIINKISDIEDNELHNYKLNILKREYSLHDIPQKHKDTATRKGQFKNERLIYVHYTYLFLIFLYILVLLGSSYILFYKESIHPTKKIFIFGSLFMIPIISTKLLHFILYFISSFYETLPKNINLDLTSMK